MYLTNLGVSKRLRCNLPIAKGQYVFGRPQNYLPERATVALATELGRDCAHFVDVGANDGLFTFSVASQNERLVLHWFEPDPAIYCRLKRNLAANAINARGNNMAVADCRGRASFFRNLTDDLTGSLRADSASRERSVEQVETISLSEYFVACSINNALVKVDVEGAGVSAWAGARNIASDIQYLIMEIIGPETECGLPGKIMSEGRLHGYYISDFNLVHSEAGNYCYQPPFWNWLFTRLSPEQLNRRLFGTKFHVL